MCLGVDRHTAVAPLPRKHPLAFVSEAQFTVTTTTSIDAADAFCQHAADAEQLGGNYRALLATSTATARSRFTMIGPWYRLDGVIATSALFLFDTPLAVTETGHQIAQDVYFGSTDLSVVGSNTCNDWSAPGVDTITGNSARSTQVAFSGGSTAYLCSNGAHLYCLEY
jgi:hypothetical protein